MDEDDGQISRMLVPVNEAFMKKDEDGEEQSLATLGLEQKGLCMLVILPTVQWRVARHMP